ncbi:hypothetical protein BDY24DRAFT_394575 [Mrakia frigida]|uniref:uncharacterized protein n=1 Tax=Mrakia frigida TaxID=29902 RepID=UPI003FCBF383
MMRDLTSAPFAAFPTRASRGAKLDFLSPTKLMVWRRRGLAIARRYLQVAATAARSEAWMLAYLRI